MKAIRSDHTGFIEHKLDTLQGGVRDKMYRICDKELGMGSYKMTTGTSPLRFPTHHKPGGVMSVTVGNPLQGSLIVVLISWGVGSTLNSKEQMEQ
jgi:hypothetical protein